MSKTNRYSVRYKRRINGKTDYKKRLKLLLSEKPRLVVRKSLNHLYAQIVEYDPNGDKIIAQANSKELEKLGWKYKGNNIPSSYLVGTLLGTRTLKHNIKEAVLDMGLYPSVKGSRVYSVLKGMLDAGVKIPHSEDILPSTERIQGKHITEFSKNKKDEIQFNNYTKQNINPENISKDMEETKKKIMGA
jgi:large subunit ribosomal protein L18